MKHRFKRENGTDLPPCGDMVQIMSRHPASKIAQARPWEQRHYR